MNFQFNQFNELNEFDSLFCNVHVEFRHFSPKFVFENAIIPRFIRSWDFRIFGRDFEFTNFDPKFARSNSKAYFY